MPDRHPALAFAVSADGSRIAYEQFGRGPAVILVGGALNDRHGRASGVALAAAMAGRLTVFAYDRRGRGDSSAAPPYAAAREIEDLAALLGAAGGAASLFGMSSGCGLVLAAAAAGLAVPRIALYDPPFSIDAVEAEASRAYDGGLRRHLAAGDPDGALALFFARVGMTPSLIDGMRAGPAWQSLAALAPTLLQDAAVLDTAAGAPLPAGLAGIAVPILVLAGARSPPGLRQSALAVAAAARQGVHRVLPGQTHNVSVEALAPILTDFFAAP